MEESLTRVLKYVSPVYQAKFKEDIEGDPDGNPPGSRHFHQNQNDKLMGWLRENRLFAISDPFPGETFHSDYGYIILGESNSMHVVHPKHRRLQYHERPKDLPENQEKDDFYYWQLTIKSQPRDSKIPKALEDKLTELEFKSAEEFKPYR